VKKYFNILSVLGFGFLGSYGALASDDFAGFNMAKVASLYSTSTAVKLDQLRAKTIRSGRCYMSDSPKQARSAVFTVKDEGSLRKLAITWGFSSEPADQYDRMSFNEAESKGRNYSEYFYDQASNSLMFYQKMAGADYLQSYK
jgi:hypothetical protein